MVSFLNASECSDWLVTLGAKTDDSGRPSRQARRLARVELPAVVSKRIAFCRALWLTIAGNSHALVWVTGWGVWPSSEHCPLVAALRRDMGTTRSLDESPGCIIDASEADSGVSMVLLAGLFGWDCWIVAGDAPDAPVFISHDEFVEFFGSQDRRSSVLTFVNEWDLNLVPFELR